MHHDVNCQDGRVVMHFDYQSRDQGSIPGQDTVKLVTLWRPIDVIWSLHIYVHRRQEEEEERKKEKERRRKRRERKKERKKKKKKRKKEKERRWEKKKKEEERKKEKEEEEKKKKKKRRRRSYHDVMNYVLTTDLRVDRSTIIDVNFWRHRNQIKWRS